MVHDFSNTHSIFSPFLGELRDKEIQKDPMRFRRNLERISEILGYELSKKLEVEIQDIETPLGVAPTAVVKEQPVIATILRAGLGMHMGLLNYFDKAESSFVSAYRKHTTAEDFEIYVEYMASPKIDNKVLIINDPMLASGASMALVYKALLKQGNPSRVIIVAAIASAQSLIYLKKYLPDTTEYYIGAVDKELTAQSYIVPGLGDAGDLAYGVKC